MQNFITCLRSKSEAKHTQKLNPDFLSSFQWLRQETRHMWLLRESLPAIELDNRSLIITKEVKTFFTRIKR